MESSDIKNSSNNHPPQQQFPFPPHGSISTHIPEQLTFHAKPDRIMQVDGMDSCSDSDGKEDKNMLQLDGAIDNSYYESPETGIYLGDNYSEHRNLQG